MRVAGHSAPSIYPGSNVDKRSDLYGLWSATSEKLRSTGHFVPYLTRNPEMETDLVGDCLKCEGLVAIDVQDGRAYGSILRIACGDPFIPAEPGGYDEDLEV